MPFITSSLSLPSPPSRSSPRSRSTPYYPFIYLFLVSWRDVPNRRALFEQYAKEHGFDPYDPNQWYSQNQDSILSTKVPPPFPPFYFYLFSLVFFYYNLRELQALLHITRKVYPKRWEISSQTSVLTNQSSLLKVPPLSPLPSIILFSSVHY